MKTAKNRIFQDARKQARILVQMDCRFESDNKEYGAIMLDLSQGGMLLSSTFLPHEQDLPSCENKVSITIEAEHGLKAPLTLKGTIKRSNIGMSEFGKIAQLGIEFEHTSLELLRLISALSRKPAQTVQDTPVFPKFEVIPHSLGNAE
jgi:hypothetical protein